MTTKSQLTPAEKAELRAILERQIAYVLSQLRKAKGGRCRHDR